MANQSELQRLERAFEQASSRAMLARVEFELAVERLVISEQELALAVERVRLAKERQASS